MSNYRFAVDHDGTITRGSMYCLPDPSDVWSNYWDGDGMVAFYDEGFRGVRAMHDGDSDTERAIVAYDHERRNDQPGALDRVARRLTGQPDSRFILVHLDRGTDLYALSWDGDADREWRNEIEAVWNGEVYRCQVEVYTPSGWFGGDWTPDDDVCEEWYGEDKAEAGLAALFPLTEFPAERLIVAGA